LTPPNTSHATRRWSPETASKILLNPGPPQLSQHDSSSTVPSRRATTFGTELYARQLYFRAPTSTDTLYFGAATANTRAHPSRSRCPCPLLTAAKRSFTRVSRANPRTNLARTPWHRRPFRVPPIETPSTSANSGAHTDLTSGEPTRRKVSSRQPRRPSCLRITRSPRATKRSSAGSQPHSFTSHTHTSNTRHRQPHTRPLTTQKHLTTERASPTLEAPSAHLRRRQQYAGLWNYRKETPHGSHKNRRSKAHTAIAGRTPPQRVSGQPPNGPTPLSGPDPPVHARDVGRRHATSRPPHLPDPNQPIPRSQQATTSADEQPATDAHRRHCRPARTPPANSRHDEPYLTAPHSTHTLDETITVGARQPPKRYATDPNTRPKTSLPRTATCGQRPRLEQPPSSYPRRPHRSPGHKRTTPRPPDASTRADRHPSHGHPKTNPMQTAAGKPDLRTQTQGPLPARQRTAARGT